MMRSWMAVLGLLAIAGCGDKDTTTETGDTEVPVTDVDGDGFDGVDHGGDDCDDADGAINPSAAEVCDGVDNNCDGVIDTDAVDIATWYQDTDGDGHGAEAYTEEACTQPSGYVALGDDCDDRDAANFPSNPEVCDDQDNDCDEDVDELGSQGETTWYADSDGDGYGVDATAFSACDAPPGYTDQGGDCRDADADTYPGADETCDGFDNDCDGETDEVGAVDAPDWWADADSDGYGDPNASTAACDQPSGYVDNDDDCDDTDGSIWPGADEYCDSVDNDCDGTVDEDDAVDASTWYADNDADTYGDPDNSTDACNQPSGYVSDSSDCDDSNPGINTAATEYCDSIDNNCDGTVDEDTAVDASTWYADADADTYGDSASTTQACSQPAGYVSDNSDCDDAASTTNPGADEICADAADNDCDGTLDECAPEGTVSLSDGQGWWTGEAAQDYAGQVVAGGGDINGDGDLDLLVAAPGSDAGASNAGSVYIIHGPTTGSFSLADADYQIASLEDGANLGVGLAMVGDVNDDGYDDFVAGAPSYDLIDEISSYSGYTDSGAAYLVYGPVTADDLDLGVYDGGPWHGYGQGGDMRYGTAVAGVGDQTGDGYADFAVGAPGDTDGSVDGGVVYVYHGPLSGNDQWDYADASALLYGEADGDEAGSALGGGGDYNGDGTPDLVVGAHFTGTDRGTSYLVFGPLTADLDLASANARWLGDAANDAAGESVALGPDVNGDGYDDALIGAPFNDDSATDAGAAYLFFGPTTTATNLTAADVILTGEVAGDRAGWSVSGGGDMDQDGYDELLVGAWGNDNGGTNAGAAYLFYGDTVSSGTWSLSSADAILEGAAERDRAGYSVAGVGDYDGDSYDDVFIGARNESSVDSQNGAAFLVLGDVR
ncbi:MAG: FG-GAP repeat protein [Alphaproteobacteria bacterium]|nr:FG-GAP repeat protein [Alphaproteobacteria bacterium]